VAVVPAKPLSDVIRDVCAALVRLGDVAAANDGSSGTARVFHGEEYVDGNSSPPLYVFVQTPAKLGPPIAIGARQMASFEAAAEIHIWGGGPSDDARVDDAWARAARLVNVFKFWAPGRLTGEALSRLTSPKVLRHGEQIVLRYSYRWAIPLDEAVQADAYANAPNPAPSPPDPDRPLGDTGLIFTTVPTTNEARP
jgi:hypothetical protein